MTLVEKQKLITLCSPSCQRVPNSRTHQRPKKTMFSGSPKSLGTNVTKRRWEENHPTPSMLGPSRRGHRMREIQDSRNCWYTFLCFKVKGRIRWGFFLGREAWLWNMTWSVMPPLIAMTTLALNEFPWYHRADNRTASVCTTSSRVQKGKSSKYLLRRYATPF